MNALGIASCLGFVCLLLGGGVLARWWDGRRSGWGRLGRRYPAGRRSAGRRPAGAAFKRASVRLNGRWYHDTADVRIGGGGILVSLPPVFRPYHPPLLLPWDDVTADETTTGGTLPLAIGDCADVLLTGRAAATAARVLARRHSRNTSSM